jgi:hypothetical protein
MNNISFFKKLKFFLFYRKTLNSVRTELEKNFNIRIDEAYRMYTVVNVNNDNSIFQDYGISELREYNKNYDLLPSQVEQQFLDEMYRKTMKDFSNTIAEYLNSKGLSELYIFYQIDKINKFSYLVVLGFPFFKTDLYVKYFYYTIRGIFIIGAILMLFKFLISSIDNF